MTKSIVGGFCGLLALGVILFSAPRLWSQNPDAVGAEKPAEPVPGGAVLAGDPSGPGGGFPGGPGGPGGFQFPFDPVSAALDTNKDREISAEEMAQAPELLLKLDKNKDGKITSDEAFPPSSFGGGRGFGGPGGGQERKLLKEFDKDGNGYLTKEERAEARQKAPPAGGGGRGFGGGPPGGGGGFGRRGGEPPRPGEKLTPADVKNFPKADLYDTQVLRTVFIHFENADWETELSDFHNTDVEVPATLTVDGKEYPNVGIHFRGMSSYMMVAAGSKRSFNLALDLADPDQKLYGYKTLNLLNSNGDSSMMSSLLYSEIARQFIPAPKANFVKVVINGESWGVYVNVQQFNKDFLKQNYPSTKGARWKVRGNPGADGGLRYVGDDIQDYRSRYQIKSTDDDKAWKDLIALCKTIDQTPPDQLEAALAPILDVDGVLQFLALDNALVNSDGYWTRSSDYSLYQDESGKFHIIPHDMNESFHSGGGPGGPGGGFGPPGGGGRGRERAGRGEQSPEGGPPARDENGPPPEEGAGPPGGGPPGGGFGPPGGGFGGRPGGGFGGGPGGPGGMNHGGVDLDPLIGLDDPRKPLRSKLLAVPSLKAKYLSDVRQIAEKSLDWKSIGPVIAQQRRLIEAEVAADTRQLGSLEAFQAATDPDSTGEGAHGLRHFFEARRAYLLANKDVAAAKPLALAERPAGPVPAAETIVTGLGPLLTKSAAPGVNSPRVVINELMASNTKTAKNPQGKYADWVEIHNPTKEALDLSGVYVTDTDRSPRKWQFAKGTVVPAGGYLVLWADEDGKSTDGLHLNIKLSSKGEDLYLVDSDERGNAVLDHILFEKLTDDVAFGRDPQRPEEWVPLLATPGDQNRVSE